jgi:hypothetical protein
VKTYVTFLESLGQQEINYCHLSELEPNEDDHEGHQCYSSVFIKETGVLADFSPAP